MREEKLPSNTQEGVTLQTRHRALIADDHVLLAEAVAAALEAPPRGFETEITGTLQQTLDALKSEVPFDLILLDIRMPGMMGLKSVKDVIARATQSKVVLLSGNADKIMVQAAVANGARGLIPKTMSIQSLVSVVDFIMSGQVFLPASEYDEVTLASSQDKELLSKRELAVLHLTSEGLTNKEIATTLGANEVGVKMHMRSICRKLEAKNRAHAVTIGNQMGLI